MHHINLVLKPKGALENQTRPSPFGDGGNSALDYAACCGNEKLLEWRVEEEEGGEKRRRALEERADQVREECKPLSRKAVTYVP